MGSKFKQQFLRRLSAFAVEDRSVQLVWGDSSPHDLTVAVGTRAVRVTNRGGAGALELDGLTPESEYRVTVSIAGTHEILARTRFRTLGALAGVELTRFATISDLHFGRKTFGICKTLTEVPQPAEPHPVRCARAAIHEAERWGAATLVVKGDITERGQRDEWRQANETLGKATVPLLALAGNHDTCRVRQIEPSFGFDVPDAIWVDDVAILDLPGIRLVLVDTAVPRKSRGAISHRADAAITAVREAQGAAMVMTHQHLQPYPVPHHHPLGISHRQAKPFLDTLAELDKPVVVSSGHSHRNRARRHGSVLLTEVGSTKDYPGVWAGYVVTEGGIRQVVRRVAEPSAIQWTEHTGRAVGGVWRRWSPGRLHDRSFTHHF